MTQIWLAPKPIMLSTRFRISSAALFVKVMARICDGITSRTFTRYEILWTRTLVLPEPAPARIRTGPSVCRTASFCSLFKPAVISFTFICLKTPSICQRRYYQAAGSSDRFCDTIGGSSLSNIYDTIFRQKKKEAEFGNASLCLKMFHLLSLGFILHSPVRSSFQQACSRQYRIRYCRN